MSLGWIDFIMKLREILCRLVTILSFSQFYKCGCCGKFGRYATTEHPLDNRRWSTYCCCDECWNDIVVPSVQQQMKALLDDEEFMEMVGTFIEDDEYDD